MAAAPAICIFDWLIAHSYSETTFPHAFNSYSPARYDVGPVGHQKMAVTVSSGKNSMVTDNGHRRPGYFGYYGQDALVGPGRSRTDCRLTHDSPVGCALVTAAPTASWCEGEEQTATVSDPSGHEHLRSAGNSGIKRRRYNRGNYKRSPQTDTKTAS